MALEKQQVQILAERVEELLDEVVRRSGGSAPVPAVSPVELDDLAPLEMPVTEDFRVGAMSLSWDGETERVVIEAGAVTGEEDVDLDDDEDGPDLLRVSLTGASAGHSPSARSPSCRPVGRRARSAACRWSPRGTSARVRTATAVGPDGCDRARLST